MENVKIIKTSKNEEVVGVLEWIISNVIMLIPVVGTVMTLVWSFSANVKNSKKTWARSSVVLWGAVFIVIGITIVRFSIILGAINILIGLGLFIAIKGSAETERENVINGSQVESIKAMAVLDWFKLMIVSLIPVVGYIVVIMIAITSKGSKQNWAIASLLTIFIAYVTIFFMTLVVVGIIGSFATDFAM